jgi:putative addiction module component (TIGR02574 family)
MGMSAAQVLEQIDKLPFEEQRDVFEQLRGKFDELGDELTPEQTAELDRRLADFEKNPDEGIPWEQVEADLNRRFGWE